MANILIVGATSAIAESVGRLYASRGARLFLVARDAERLEAVVDDLIVRGGKIAGTYLLDVNDLDRQEKMLDAAWEVLGDVDVLLIAHGTLPDVKRCSESSHYAMQEFTTNASSTVGLCILASARLRAPATLAVISSVAGDRGRASNFLYGSAKAAVTACTSGLRQRLNPSGVNVLTILPGFVDTPMTVEFRKGLLWVSPDTIAVGIVSAVEKRKGVVYLPWFWWPIMQVIKHIPEALFRRLRL